MKKETSIIEDDFLAEFEQNPLLSAFNSLKDSTQGIRGKLSAFRLEFSSCSRNLSQNPLEFKGFYLFLTSFLTRSRSKTQNLAQNFRVNWRDLDVVLLPSSRRRIGFEHKNPSSSFRNPNPNPNFAEKTREKDYRTILIPESTALLLLAHEGVRRFIQRREREGRRKSQNYA